MANGATIDVSHDHKIILQTGERRDATLSKSPDPSDWGDLLGGCSVNLQRERERERESGGGGGGGDS